MGHHYLPQQYLRGFEAADEPGAIWSYDKVTRRFARITIKVVAQEAEFYDADVEKELNESVEGPAHASMAKVRRQEPFSLEDRLRLAVYAATMIMRVPHRRRKAFELIPSALATTMDEMRGRIAEWSRSPNADQSLVARRLGDVDRLQEEFLRRPPADVVDRIRSPWPSQQLVGLLHGMTWRIVGADPANRFLTSDNPAYFFEAFGLGKPEAEFTFPLASDLALLASWQGPREGFIVVQAKPRLVKEVNRRVASGAERFVFYHQRQDWVGMLADKVSPYLSRIQW